jgi:hypothetical protein
LAVAAVRRGRVLLHSFPGRVARMEQDMKDDRAQIARLNAIIHNQRDAIRHLEFVIREMRKRERRVA